MCTPLTGTGFRVLKVRRPSINVRLVILPDEHNIPMCVEKSGTLQASAS
jgi:hypothetical protein